MAQDVSLLAAVRRAVQDVETDFVRILNRGNSMCLIAVEIEPNDVADFLSSQLGQAIDTLIEVANVPVTLMFTPPSFDLRVEDIKKDC